MIIFLLTENSPKLVADTFDEKGHYQYGSIDPLLGIHKYFLDSSVINFIRTFASRNYTRAVVPLLLPQAMVMRV